MSTSRHPSVTIIGAGFGGLGTALALQQAGLTDVTLLEKADDIGGVWRENTYPGAACDVPSALYSWSFAPHPGWQRRYSGQADILAYIRRTAQERGLRDRVRTGVEVTGATWDERAARWLVHTSAGETLETDVLVSAVGQLSRPVVPAVPGVETFSGPEFHSARWRHDVDLTGKQVAVIGTGASAIQFVPGIVDQVGAMTVFQRSAPYVVPKPDRAYTRLHRWIFARWPRTQALGRRTTFVLSERLNKALVAGTWVTKVLRLAFRLTLRRQLPDPELRAKVTPDYPIGCKRMLFSNDWYPALARPHVDVVTERVTEITPDGVRTDDGSLHPADVIIWGTGFAATDFLVPLRITGTGGQDLHEHWAEGARAHLGMTVPGFPNLFLIYGPNTNLGGSSIISMMEAQAGYLVEAVRSLAEGRTAVLEVRREVADRFDAEMQERLARTVWSGCDSWYREPGGRVTTNWPGLVAEYQRRAAGFELDDFEPAPVVETVV
ncbi:NAD(P)/FAD-dependent oxidoreductase [Nocardioides sp.]|uniref:flavin-containing monooxygenase n=1 Tax=Nocardioides sp. TaxID=35761 RepID=UPI002736A063|nr:NAD(P)/FAD-dependent oxidoreductase [Nocardioides sp.]MDP3891132.1 NAD(P)/FAD-dependent oxidoreductase [Nocardioides sp.]